IKRLNMKSRRFISLPSLVQKELQHQYQHLHDALVGMYDGEDTCIKSTSVSVFDHWLSPNEATAMLQDVTSSMQNEYNSRLHKFVCLLSDSYECYLVLYKGRYSTRITYRKFTSDNARFKTLLPSDYRVPDKDRFKFVIPQLGIIYFEGCDFTHNFHFSDESVLKLISTYAKEAEVYLI
ncbi:TPA: hypothetical protein ACGUPE_004472, partial [Vibrio vulnificus]